MSKLSNYELNKTINSLMQRACKIEKEIRFEKSLAIQTMPDLVGSSVKTSQLTSQLQNLNNTIYGLCDKLKVSD